MNVCELVGFTTLAERIANKNVSTFAEAAFHANDALDFAEVVGQQFPRVRYLLDRPDVLFQTHFIGLPMRHQYAERTVGGSDGR